MSSSWDEQVEQLAAMPEPQLREKLRKVERERRNVDHRSEVTRSAMRLVIERNIWAAHPDWKRESPVTQGKVRRMVVDEWVRIMGSM